MGFLDSVKDIYFQAEDKYYQFLDKIDEKIPVYKIIDPIDSIVPSFAVLLLAAFLAILLGIGAIASILFTPTTSTLSVTVLDSGGEPIEGAMVKFIVLGEEKKIQQTGADGTAFLENLAKELEVVVEASKENFLTKTQTVTITELPQQLLQITLEEEGAAVLSKTIRIVDVHGAALSKYFTLSFRCTSPYAVPPADVELSPRDNGVARVLAPTNCETLLVSVTNDADFEPVASFEVFAEQTDVKIEMEETERETGTIAVILKTGGEIVSQPVEVQLYRYEELLANPEIGPIDTDISSGGEAGFGVSAGNYVVKSVATSSLGAATSPRISVQAGETKEVTLELSKTVVGEIKIKVVDSDSDEPVDDAKVTLKFQSDDRVLAAKETDKDEDSIVGFSISADVAYRVVVEAEGFQLAKRESLRISDAIVTIGLEKCTPSTCGELRVKVIDQDGEPVENATVALYNADTDFLAGFSTKTSDANGEAEFGGVHSGNYFAFAFKESVSGRSDPAFFSSSAPKKEETHLTVTMVVPNGLIKATIADKDNRPIPFAFVGLYDDRTEELLGSAIGDANGSFSFETKADKKVYLKIRKKDSTPKYADYVTAAKPVIAGTVQQFNVTLEPEIIDKDIEIEFLGLFSADGKTATVLSKGEEFVAKLRLLVPEEKDYRETGVHLRTGTELIMEKDALFVKKVNAPATSQIRATKFDEKSGLEETQYDFTNSEAKWVNLVWSNPDAGIYEIEAVVAVKETASISNELKIFWRAWALDGARERHPQDDTITKELYSEAFSRIYEIGVTTLCDDEFCFSARIRDIEEGLIEPVVDTYNARMVKEYELKFTILNNSTFRIHDLANLRIANEDETLVFKEYQIIDAQTRPTSGTLNGSEFPRFEVGKLEPKNKIDFSTKFITQKVQSGTINIRLVSDEQIVFEKNLNIIVGATKKLEVVVQPAIFPSGIENDINVFVVDATTKLEIEGATVRLKDRHENVVLHASTKRDGYALLTLPAQLPGTTLFLEIEKPLYETKTIELKIRSDIVQINPDRLGVALNTKTLHSAQTQFNLTNLTPFPLKVGKLTFRGEFKNLLDQKATQDSLDLSYKDFVLEAGKTKEFVLKVFLSEEGKGISKRQDIDAFLDLEISNFGKNWPLSIPVRVAIDIEGAVDNPACLVLNRSSWQTTTEGDPVRMELVIENNCTIDGQPIELKKLFAQVQLESNNLGIYEIAIGENKTELASGYDKMLVSRIAGGQRISAILSFTPFGGVNGESTAKIKISATNPQETDEQVLEQAIDAKITIVNLVQCISIDPVLIEITGQGESGTRTEFNINAGNGNVSCGGPVDYLLESELEVTPKEGRIEDGAKQAIKVLRGDAIQGQYPVFVKAKFGSEQEEQLIGTVRVRITEPGCLQLSRYEFDLYDDPLDEFDGLDTTTITNKCFDKPVPVRVNLQSFSEAMKFGSTIGLLTFGVSLLGHGLGTYFGGGGTGTVLYKTENEMKQLYGTGGLVDLGVNSDGDQIYKVANGKAPYYYRVEKGLGSTKYYPFPQYKEEKPDKVEGEGNSTPRTGTGNVIFPIAGSLEDNPFNYGTATGLAVLINGTPTGLQTAPQNQQGGGLLGGMFGGGGIWGMGGNIVDGILGKSDPLTQGLQAFLLASIFDYYNQEEKASFVTIQRDVEVLGLEIQKPGEEATRSNVFTTVLQNRFFSKFVKQNVPAYLQPFLPYFSGSASFFDIVTKGDEDLEVVSERRPTVKALPISGLPPEMFSAFFGGSGDKSFPAVSLFANPDASNQKIEKRGIIFKNKSGFTTTKEKPLYKILRVNAIRHQYKDKEYDRGDFDVENERGWFSFDFEDPIVDPTSGELEELPPVPVDEQFHLEFNAVPPEVFPQPLPSELLNCQDGFRVGTTGPDAIPKVKFEWSWNAIGENECNADNEEGIFCDATQFGISTLKKIRTISEWASANGPGLTCPGLLDAHANTAEIPEFDVGISKAAVRKATDSATAAITVTNKNPGEINSKVTITLRSAASGQIVSGKQCIETKKVLSEEEFLCEFSGLERGNYIVEAALEPTVACSNCQNNSNSDFLSVNFTIGQTGLEECEPFSTARLDQFTAASGLKADDILAKIKFRANLIEDRYSADFQKDFDEFAKTQSFFDAPQSYTDERGGLGVYFKDTKLFAFSSKFDEPNPEGYRLPGPGIYNVEIDITFNDNSWALFKNDKPNAKIVVSLEKADTPEPDSPFYRLPFDGTIGEDGRTNYGLSFRGDNILVNNDPDGILRTIEIPNSSPVAELTVAKNDSFKFINTDERGLVLKVLGGANPALTFAPSFATPVILKMTNTSSDAYAFYSVEVDGGAANTGPYLTRWNGVGFNCKAFDDRFLSEFFFSSDTHGLNEFRQCARVPGEKEQTSYGFEFCSPTKFGTMHLKTVLYTPQGHQSYLNLNVAQEEASFITPTTSGTKVPLATTALGSEINSVEDIFNLVGAEFVCVSNEESKTEFWWNPKKIHEQMADKEAELAASCIEP